MASGSQAYDLSRYEPKVVEQPKVRVVKRAQPVKSVYGVRPITLVMVAMIVVSVTALLLYLRKMLLLPKTAAGRVSSQSLDRLSQKFRNI